MFQIRVWAAHQLDIGVVARVGAVDMALVFRCETDAKGVAAAIHANCLRLANEIKQAKEKQRPFNMQGSLLYLIKLKRRRTLAKM